MFQGLKIGIIWNNKWFNVSLTFYGISKIENSEKKERFSIGLDANLNKGEFHAIRLDEQTFLIPKKLSDSKQSGRFFISEFSVTSGAFGKLYDYLPIEKKTKLESACQYLKNNENVQKILERIKNNETYIKRSNSHVKKVHDFYEINGIDNLQSNIKLLANTCYNFKEVQLAQSSQSSDNSESSSNLETIKLLSMLLMFFEDTFPTFSNDFPSCSNSSKVITSSIGLARTLMV